MLGALESSEILSPDATWAGAMLLIVAGIFLASITIGVVSRIILPERHIESVESDSQHPHSTP